MVFDYVGLRKRSCGDLGGSKSRLLCVCFGQFRFVKGQSMFKIKGFAALLCGTVLLSSCVSGDVLESASSSSAPLVETRTAGNDTPAATSQVVSIDQSGALEPANSQGPAVSQTDLPTPQTRPDLPEQTVSTDTPDQSPALLAAVDPSAQIDGGNGIAAGEAEGLIQPPIVKGPEKTYLINGLLSAVPFIGYGFRNLKAKMPGAKLYSYMGVVEGPAAIAPEVIKDATAAWRADPTTRINLIGISLGADLITVIAEKLDKKGVPVAYLGIVDGTNLRPITANVKIADNLTCSNLDCTRAKAKLAKGNNTTILTRKVYRSSHIPLGNNDELHARVISQTR